MNDNEEKVEEGLASLAKKIMSFRGSSQVALTQLLQTVSENIVTAARLNLETAKLLAGEKTAPLSTPTSATVPEEEELIVSITPPVEGELIAKAIAESKTGTTDDEGNEIVFDSNGVTMYRYAPEGFVSIETLIREMQCEPRGFLFTPEGVKTTMYDVSTVSRHLTKKWMSGLTSRHIVMMHPMATMIPGKRPKSQAVFPKNDVAVAIVELYAGKIQPKNEHAEFLRRAVKYMQAKNMMDLLPKTLARAALESLGQGLDTDGEM